MQPCPVCLSPPGPHPLPPCRPPRTSHSQGGLEAPLQEELGCCTPAGIFQGRGEGLATTVWASCSPGPPSSQEAYPSGGDSGAGSSCRRLRAPLPRPVRKAGQETCRLPSSWWVPSPVHRRGSGEPSPSSPEPKKSNSLMASSESSSSSSSSISGTRALEGSCAWKKPDRSGGSALLGQRSQGS